MWGTAGRVGGAFIHPFHPAFRFDLQRLVVFVAFTPSSVNGMLETLPMVHSWMDYNMILPLLPHRPNREGNGEGPLKEPQAEILIL